MQSLRVSFISLVQKGSLGMAYAMQYDSYQSQLFTTSFTGVLFHNLMTLIFYSLFPFPVNLLSVIILNHPIPRFDDLL